VLDGGGEADDGVAGLVVSFGESHCAHGGNGNTGASYCGDDFNHGSSGYQYSVATAANQSWLIEVRSLPV